jgi:hypothetical protein
MISLMNSVQKFQLNVNIIIERFILVPSEVEPGVKSMLVFGEFFAPRSVKVVEVIIKHGPCEYLVRLQGRQTLIKRSGEQPSAPRAGLCALPQDEG